MVFFTKNWWDSAKNIAEMKNDQQNMNIDGFVKQSDRKSLMWSCRLSYGDIFLTLLARWTFLVGRMDHKCWRRSSDVLKAIMFCIPVFGRRNATPSDFEWSINDVGPYRNARMERNACWWELGKMDPYGDILSGRTFRQRRQELRNSLKPIERLGQKLLK